MRERSPVPTAAPPVVRSAVAVELADVEGASARAVLSAALQLFGPDDPVDVLLVLPGVDAPAEEHGAVVQGLVLGLADDVSALPEVLLVGEPELSGHELLVRVVASGAPAADARAVVLLSAAARTVWDAADSARPLPTHEVLDELEDAMERLRAERDRAVALVQTARRDARRRRCGTGTGRPRVVLVFQHRSYWGAVATLWEALEASAEVDIDVVALDSSADGRSESTAAFLADQGVATRTGAWLEEHLDHVDAVVLLDPYDSMRPAELHVAALAARGVRLVAVPYGGNAIAGPLMDALLWDQALQRLAWRVYLASPAQAALMARHCRAGAEHVRVLGSPKTDRVVRGGRTPGAEALRRWAGGRPLVLWNPHFRVGEGGWSTFDRYVGPLLRRFAGDPSMVLLLRPHFRLWPDLQVIGGDAARVEADVRAFVAAHENVRLDETPDYLDALTACDAMLSDLSSLASELLPTGTPICWLHREDGPGPNEEGKHFSSMYRAEDEAAVHVFLDQVTRGEDPRRAQRLEAVQRDMPYADGGAGARIAADLVASLREEFR